MIDLPPLDPVSEPVMKPAAIVEQVGFVDDVGRVVSFALGPGQAVPETRRASVVIVALTDLSLEAGHRSQDPTRLTLQAGQASLLPDGFAGLANTGDSAARFTLIDAQASD